MEEKINKIYEVLKEEINQEYTELRSKAYNTSLSDSFAICLRDDFNVNDGKRAMLVKFYNMIMESIKAEED